jgi:hypothetical protein
MTVLFLVFTHTKVSTCPVDDYWDVLYISSSSRTVRVNVIGVVHGFENCPLTVLVVYIITIFFFFTSFSSFFLFL